MPSIVIAVLQATVGLLLDKARDVAAENLRHGDVTDQKLRTLVVREIENIKQKLEGLARQDLLASICFFKEGIEFLCEALDKTRYRVKSNEVIATVGIANDGAVCITEGMENLELAGLDEASKRALANAKKRFDDARREATKAFANEALELSDRVLAMQYRVMATILETIDNPKDALPACRVCIEDLHCLSGVRNCFNIELNNGLRARFSKNERRTIISTVCHVSHVIYEVTRTVDDNISLLNWPCIHCEEEKIDLLRDSRVAKILREQGVDNYCVMPWSFGHEGKEEQRLKNARGIVVNTQDHFLIGDTDEEFNRSVKVFDKEGTFLSSFGLVSTDESTALSIYDVTVDAKDNVYVLVRLMKPGADRNIYMSVYMYDNTGLLHQRFPLRDGPSDWFWYALTVNDNNKILVVASKIVDMYEADGQFVRKFGEGILMGARGIAASTEGRVIVMDRGVSRFHVYSEKGEHLLKYDIPGSYIAHTFAFHPQSKLVVVIGKERWNGIACALLYTEEGDFVRSIQLGMETLPWVTVTKEGRLAVPYKDTLYQCKIRVL